MLYTSIGFVVVGKLIIFSLFGLYEKWWRYFRLPDYAAVLKATLVSTLLILFAFNFLKPYDDDLPRSVIGYDFLLTLALVGGARLLVRMIVERPRRAASATR